MRSLYQLLPSLREDELQELERSIREEGFDEAYPVVTDEDGNILDGHHRAAIAERLGIEYPVVIKYGMAEHEKRLFAVERNVQRRHLTDLQRRLLGEDIKPDIEARATAIRLANLKRGTESPNASNEAFGRTTDQAARTVGIGSDTTFERQGKDIKEAVNVLGKKEVERLADEGATMRQLRQAVARQRQHDPVPIVALPDDKYHCIVIDPPWPVQKIEREERPDQGVVLDYPVMSLDQISELPVGDLGDDDGCHIYLWVTQKYLPAGLQLLEGWGYRYQCVMTWVKPTGMTPYSWMYNTEHVLFGRKGNLKLDRMGLKLSFEAPVTKHSKKPDVFYERVVAATPGPRLEMFARTPREGFEVWGNEVVANAA